jgi:hypothetical protein
MRKYFFLSFLPLFLLGLIWVAFRSGPIASSRDIPLSSNPQISDKVLICGVCRNIEQAIANTRRSVSDLGSRFSDYRFIAYENNSTDNTKKILHAWAEKDPHFIFLSEQLSKKSLASQLEMKILHRTEKIARARNIVLDQAMRKDFDDFKYVIWADLDFLEPWDVDAIVATILHPEQEWDAVFANGAYDLFALRTPDLPIGFELIGDIYWGNLDRIRSCFHMDINDPWKRVYSAFGGIGIYKREAMRGCRYSGVVNRDLEKMTTVWLSMARTKGDVLFLSEYDELLSQKAPMQLKGPILRKRSYYPDHIGVRIPHGKLVWFSCTHDATLPWTCEHVPFHASMILHGYDRFFINPKIRCNP